MFSSLTRKGEPEQVKVNWLAVEILNEKSSLEYVFTYAEPSLLRRNVAITTAMTSVWKHLMRYTYKYSF